MPARFVEITNPIHVARNTDPLAYVQTMKWDISAWGASTLDGWVGSTNTTNTTNSFALASLLTRATVVLSKVQPPQGLALWALCTAVALVLLRCALLRRATRRVVLEYGHAHAE
tara:strand:- start:536 stop:877 length:342 start_codon:yes stop_codon:yes gene_type:complete